jgi:putative membrane-bound dehydrogenase-like protein
MSRLVRYCPVAAFCLGLFITSAVTAADRAMPVVPDGFRIEKVAGPGLVERPVHASFDDQGRLYVVDSAGVNFGAEELAKVKPHKIVRLEDTNGDGRFDRRVVFSEGITLPMGVLCYRDVVYVASPPAVWMMKDTDGDGKADEKKIIVTGYGWTGNAASIHGPFVGPNGWLYLNHGRKGHRIEHDGTITEGKAAGLWRFRHDGTQLERVAGGGFDNPVEAIFTPTGEIITTMTFFTVPKDGKRDALLHFIEGGVFPRDDERVMSVVNELKQTGDLLPALCEMGVYAPSGLEIHSGTQYGEEYSGNLFSTQFNMRRVQRHVLTRDGATFHCTAEDFLTCDDPDFHPTDTLEDADGSLLVIDTGGWFRKGCPTSKIAKPDVLGAIYRVSRVEAEPINAPRGLALGLDKAPPKTLLAHLGDPRPTVREQATDRLAQLDEKQLADSTFLAFVKVFDLTANETARRNFVWAMSRIESDRTLPYLRAGLSSRHLSVRIAAARSLGIRRDARSIPGLIRLLDEKQSPALRREAATALGRIAMRGEKRVRDGYRGDITQAIFRSLRSAEKDRFLEHSLIFALIRIAEREACLPYLADRIPHIRRCALIALDQMDNGELTRELVTPLLDTEDPALRQRTLAVISKHTGWSEATFDLLSGWMTDRNPAPERVVTLRGFLLAQTSDPIMQQFLVDSLDGDQASPAARLVLLEVIARAELTELPKSWVASAGKHLTHADPSVRQQAIDIMLAHGIDLFDTDLRKLISDAGQLAGIRIAALQAMAARTESVSEDDFGFLSRRFNSQVHALQQVAAARTLAALPLTDPQLADLANSLPFASPMALPVLVDAYTRSKTQTVGLKLIRKLDERRTGQGIATLTRSGLLQAVAEYPDLVRSKALKLSRRLPGESPEKQKQRMDELTPLLANGDVTKGKSIFHGKKAACAACHTAGGKGGKVGPDLTGIGKIRAGRDLVEAIAFPSATFARGFRSYVIATDAGRIYTGVITRETPQTITLRSTDLAEIRISKSSIEVMKESETSIMPKGLDKTLTRDELRDLLAFLQSQK